MTTSTNAMGWGIPAKTNPIITEQAEQIKRLRAALAHALAFIEHEHKFDESIETIDSFIGSVDGGPVMECNLKQMREALQ